MLISLSAPGIRDVSSEEDSKTPQFDKERLEPKLRPKTGDSSKTRNNRADSFKHKSNKIDLYDRPANQQDDGPYEGQFEEVHEESVGFRY